MRKQEIFTLSEASILRQNQVSKMGSTSKPNICINEQIVAFEGAKFRLAHPNMLIDLSTINYN